MQAKIQQLALQLYRILRPCCAGFVVQLGALEKQRLKRMTAAAGTETGDADKADAAPAQAVAVILTAMLCSWGRRECQDIWHAPLCFRPWLNIIGGLF